MVKSALDKAIDMHKEHIANPVTATAKSQRQLLDLLMAHKKEMVADEKDDAKDNEAADEKGMAKMMRKAKTLVG